MCNITKYNYVATITGEANLKCIKYITNFTGNQCAGKEIILTITKTVYLSGASWHLIDKMNLFSATKAWPHTILAST